MLHSSAITSLRSSEALNMITTACVGSLAFKPIQEEILNTFTCN